MKKNLFSLTVTIVLFSFFGTAAQAQHDYTWDYYKISMTLPADFKVTKNTDTEFDAVGQGMELSMDVFADKHVTIDGMKDATIDFVKSLKLDHVDEVHNIKDDDFQGKYVLGAKGKDAIMVAGLIVPHSTTNLWVVITFADGDANAEADGLKILNSLVTH